MTNQFDVVQVPELAEEDGALDEATVEITRCAFVAAAAADEKLGTDTIVLGMSELLPVVDAFVVTSGRNVRQVRSMVGSLEHVGSGKWTPADLRAALDSKDRARCGQVAPAAGLYLIKVDY